MTILNPEGEIDTLENEIWREGRAGEGEGGRGGVERELKVRWTIILDYISSGRFVTDKIPILGFLIFSFKS